MHSLLNVRLSGVFQAVTQISHHSNSIINYLGIAAAITTPLDVIKTRIMLSNDTKGINQTFKSILKEEGGRVLLSGIGPRIVWISLGGFVFLGVYEQVKLMISKRSIM